jgi:hypothetical protein
VRVRYLIDDAGPVGVGEAVDAQQDPRAQRVGLGQADVGTVGAPASTGAEAGLQRPGVARPHFDVDDSVAVGDRNDADIVEDPVRAQEALGLLDGVHRDALAALEEELLRDDARAGLDVDCIGGAIEHIVLALAVQVEDVGRDDPDFADHRTGRLELGERGDFLGGGRGCFGRRRGGSLWRILLSRGGYAGARGERQADEPPRSAESVSGSHARLC